MLNVKSQRKRLKNQSTLLKFFFFIYVLNMASFVKDET